MATFAQKDGQYYMINDSKIISSDRKTTSAEDLDELIRKNMVVEATTHEELAKKINVPAAALIATVKKFNESVDKKSDEFGRDIWENKIDKGSFYATLRFPALHHTMGGIKINENAEVIGKEGKAVPGLFAAGEVTGGIHGANRLGGNAIADIIVFGRIAGKNAANAK
ncbi:FAD-binding protein [Fusobacterium sp.]|uniref:FAD-binding protein n=1 Tax=Fusobacterium sp. TaxID=68766 RepID=UPI0029052418|nr:FAD-binding protein [Fusobacterium sp.]MDU1912250.1 FAD-binding protein [Fusobacterium sp.]